MRLKVKKCAGCQSKQDSCRCFECDGCCKRPTQLTTKNSGTELPHSAFMDTLDKNLDGFSYSEIIRLERIIRNELSRRRMHHIAILSAKRGKKSSNPRQQSKTKRKSNEED